MSEFEQDSQTGDAVLIAACLQANSLQTGNFTGNLTILAGRRPDYPPGSAAAQRLLGQFPTPTNRQFSLANRVSSGA
jgi:hypothetical protein